MTAQRTSQGGGTSGGTGGRTAGTNRDYDETETSANQAHGHPREERSRSEQAGVSNRVVRDRVRGDDKPGGKVRSKRVTE